MFFISSAVNFNPVSFHLNSVRTTTLTQTTMETTTKTPTTISIPTANTKAEMVYNFRRMITRVPIPNHQMFKTIQFSIPVSIILAINNRHNSTTMLDRWTFRIEKTMTFNTSPIKIHNYKLSQILNHQLQATISRVMRSNRIYKMVHHRRESHHGQSDHFNDHNVH